jgi:imidazole glycerol-phosphate synthase subunit HisF
MLRPRIIPSLLVHQGGLVKTIGFKDPKYVGDPINAVKIFNEKESDELAVFDIDASADGSEPDYRMIAHLAAECRMPLCYGGGVRTAEQAGKIIGLGVEKVSISSAAVERPSLIAEIAEQIGRQSVAVVLDVRKKRLGGYELRTHNAKRAHKVDPVAFAQDAVRLGAGEIVINSIDLDGTMKGYDLKLARRVREAVDVPVTFLGGAGSLDHIEALIREVGVVGAAAGSLFVFKGAYRAVLINYPDWDAKDKIVRATLAA